MATSSFEGTVLIPTFLFQVFHVSLDLLNMDCLIRIRRGILVFKTIPMSCMSRLMCFNLFSSCFDIISRSIGVICCKFNGINLQAMAEGGQLIYN